MLRERPRVVILGSLDDSGFGVWLHRWLRLPFVVFAHGNEVLAAARENHKGPRQGLKIANSVLANSRYIAGL
jgi:hypothetical protein